MVESMSEKLEQVARSLAANDGNLRDWPTYLSASRAAVEAMREPTETMVKRAQPIARDNYPADVWHAMIDEILK